MPNLIGIIESGKFRGRRIILGKRESMDRCAKEWWVEDGTFLGGGPKFVRACIKHDILDIPLSGCPKCKEEQKNAYLDTG